MDDTSPDLVCPACGGRGREAFCPVDGLRRVPPTSLGTGDPLIGTVIAGRYAIERRLGQGGMGAVYLATQSLMERKVVVKVMRSDTGYNDVVRGRFLREARAASRVTHPNVITIFDFGYTDDGMAYLVMELVDGPSLNEVLEVEERLPWRRAARIIAQAARALEAAHRAGIVHRDVKPGNVMLTKNDAGDEVVKVLDFGVARVHDSGDARLTRTGAVMGTPAYMAPEQAAGREVGPPADIYALGAMLFDLVTGELPFSGQNITDVLLQHLSAAPPTMRSVVDDDVDIPEALEALVASCMRKKPEERSPSAAALADALERILAGGEVADVVVMMGARLAAPESPSPEAPSPALEETGEAPSPPPTTSRAQETGPSVIERADAARPTRRTQTRRRKASWWALVVWFAVAAVAVLALVLRPGEPDEPSADETRGASAADAVATDTRAGEDDEETISAPVLPAIPAPRGLRLDGLPVDAR